MKVENGLNGEWTLIGSAAPLETVDSPLLPSALVLLANQAKWPQRRTASRNRTKMELSEISFGMALEESVS